MTRNLKTLSLAPIAAFATAALAAPAAQAVPEITWENYPAFTHAKAEQKIGEENEYFEVNGYKLECETVHFTGETTSISRTTHTITPDYTDHTQKGNCLANGVLKTTITENTCGLIFLGLETGTDKKDYKTAVTVECPVGGAIWVHINALFGEEYACTFTIAAQNATGKFTVTNMSTATPPDITIEGTVELEATQHNHESGMCGGAPKETIKNVKSHVRAEKTDHTHRHKRDR